MNHWCQKPSCLRLGISKGEVLILHPASILFLLVTAFKERLPSSYFDTEQALVTHDIHG